jgi:serine phosphatase RsbU (regulator of sigma subunit)
VSRSRKILLALALLFVVGLVAALRETPWVSVAGVLVLTFSTVGLLLALGYWWFRWFLWKVGRRLAFSYFLIGIVPIPLVLLLLLGGLYLLSGFFLGNQVREALTDLQRELEVEAAEALEDFTLDSPAPEGSPLAVALYRDGRKVAGPAAAPAAWPGWLEDRPPLDHLVQVEKDGPVTLAAVTETDRHSESESESESERGALVYYAEPLETPLRTETGFWIEGHYLGEPEEDDGDGRVRVSLGNRSIPVRSLGGNRRPEEARAFFAARREGGGWPDRASLYWGELPGGLHRLSDGELVSEETIFAVNATPRSVFKRLFSSNSEVDSTATVLLIVAAGLLADVYLAAALMAVFLIFGISRAVNRLSTATTAVQAGDFSTRIPVRRKDQIGELQRNFNRMAENLESLVAEATQKELLEQELAIARDLQESLLPRDIDVGPEVDVATLFLPSAAIGGDYYDVIRLSPERLLVVVADVSGHGLPTGLRMAMLKAALTVLVERLEEPAEILRRLDSLIRADGDRRFFVTAILAVLDLPTGELHLVNAGHPPTYLVHPGLQEGTPAEVEEILLPAPPLGALRPIFAETRRRLRPGDLLVWMSDGILEATDADDEPLGYDGVRRVLEQPAGSAKDVRDRLLRAVAEHAGERAAGDDRTRVVLRYLGS